MDPLEKELTPGWHASLDASGTLIITELPRVPLEEVLMDPPTPARVELPAWAARALLNMLHSPTGRARIGARKLR